MESYRERLWPSWWLTLALGLFLPAGFLIFLPLNPLVGFGVGMVLWWGSWAVLALSSPVIEIGESGFRAGRATIGWDHVACVEEIEKADFRQAVGPGLDARAWLVIRPWASGAIRLTVNDPDDPTPYWVVSTAAPRLVAQASAHWLDRV